jgi:poly(A) polymerase
VHLEEQICFAPDWLVRLAAISGPEAANRLRLSRSDEVRLCTLRDGLGSPRGAGELGFRHGADNAIAILLLRCAVMETPLKNNWLVAAKAGANAVFPLRAADLMPALTGPALGRELERLKSLWIASDFALTRAEVLEAR